MLMTVIGEEALDVFAMFWWADARDKKKIDKVLEKFGEYCKPKNVPFEWYIFYKREQGPEESFEQYYTELRRLAQNCAFDSITPDEVLRNRLVVGIWDSSVRERLFGLPDLTLEKTEEICRRADRTEFQM